jgi:membrane protein required for colicin V production
VNYLDIFFIVVFIIGAIKGYMRGLIVEIFSFIAFFAGLFISIKFSVPISRLFFEGSEYSQMLTVGVFIILFVLAVLVVNLVAKMIKKVLDLTFIGFFDNILGALAGIFKWAFIVSVFFWVFDSIGLRFSAELASESMIFPYIQSLGPSTFELLGGLMPFVQDMIDSLKGVNNNAKDVYTFLQ